VIIWNILHHVVSALTMTKTAEIAKKIEKDALLFGTYIKHNNDNTTIKELL
jgi:hypothetical protein